MLSISDGAPIACGGAFKKKEIVEESGGVCFRYQAGQQTI